MADETSSAPVFRHVTAADAERVLPVLLAAFPQWPPFEIDVPPIDHLRWKMSPTGQPGDLHGTSEVDGRVLGVQLRWMGRVELRGHVHQFDGGVDLAVHPDARGRGLGSLLRDREAARTFGSQRIRFDTTPANPLSRQMYEARGPISRPLDLWLRALTWRAFIGIHARAGPAQLLRSARGTLHARPAAPRDGHSVEQIARFDTRAEALWDRVRGEYALARIRDTEWLNWRYCDPRAGLIRAYQLADGDRLLGYAVFRRDRHVGRLLDLVTDPTTPGAAAGLLDRGIADLRDGGCTSVECLLPPGHREAAALRDAGFLPQRAARELQVTRARHEAVPAFLDVIADPTVPIHVMSGDFDHQ